MTALEKFRFFRPPGPVAQAFMEDRQHKVRALLGPVGGGKTVSCVFDTLRNASLMPACNDGIIRYRIAVIGGTYGQLERNLYPSWTTWLPKSERTWVNPDWKGGGGRFAEHDLKWQIVRDGKRVPVHFQAIFAAIGEQAVEDFMRGFEPTAFWLYEMDLLSEGVLDHAMFRVGRYPATSSDGRPDAVDADIGFRSYVIGDLNAPDTDSWFYERFEANSPPEFTVYKQPSGLSPEAENIHNLPGGRQYYANQLSVLKSKRGGKYLIMRMIEAKYAPSLDGEPVYFEVYDDAIHLAPEQLEPLSGVPITLGFDQGLRRPACVAGQVTPAGQFRVFAECVPGRMSARRFGEQVKVMLRERAPGIPLAPVHYADPAGFLGADKEDGESAWAETVAQVLDVTISPTETNEIDARIAAVEQELRDPVGSGMPGLIICPSCKLLRKGFVSDYRYRKEKIGNTERTSDRPDKRMAAADPHDALQYLVLGVKGKAAVMAGVRGGVDDLAAEAEAVVARVNAGGGGVRWRKPARREDDDCVAVSAPGIAI